MVGFMVIVRDAYGMRTGCVQEIHLKHIKTLCFIAFSMRTGCVRDRTGCVRDRTGWRTGSYGIVRDAYGMQIVKKPLFFISFL